MITGEKKQQVDAIWQTFWNNGFTQLSAIFEQMTYLLFMNHIEAEAPEVILSRMQERQSKTDTAFAVFHKL